MNLLLTETETYTFTHEINPVLLLTHTHTHTHTPHNLSRSMVSAAQRCQLSTSLTDLFITPTDALVKSTKVSLLIDKFCEKGK